MFITSDDIEKIMDSFANMYCCVVMSNAFVRFGDLWPGDTDVHHFITDFIYLRQCFKN